jgi:hypothetical protein
MRSLDTHAIHAASVGMLAWLAARTQGMSAVVTARQLPRLQLASFFGAQGWTN